MRDQTSDLVWEWQHEIDCEAEERLQRLIWALEAELKVKKFLTCRDVERLISDLGGD